MGAYAPAKSVISAATADELTQGILQATVDGMAGSHWEHSVAVHDGGVWVLTAPDGGAEGLAPFGVTPREIA